MDANGRKRGEALPPYEIRIVSNGAELRKIGAQAFMDYINPFVDERAYLSVQKKVTFREEKGYMEERARALDSGCEAMIYLFINGKVAGVCNARQATLQSEKGNVSFGLSVSKEFRGFGFGELLLREGIALVKRKFKPHKMWIEHDAKNTVAARLYQKVGFVKVARLREYHLHYGKYHDKVIQEYRGA